MDFWSLVRWYIPFLAVLVAADVRVGAFGSHVFSALGESPRDGISALCVPLFVCWVSVYVCVCAH